MSGWFHWANQNIIFIVLCFDLQVVEDYDFHILLHTGIVGFIDFRVLFLILLRLGQ